MINIPGLDKTLPVSVFAIDVNTAKNVSVDNHYLLRYGTIFATSFVEGLSEAMTQSGQSTTISGTTGAVQTVKEKLSNSKLIAAGLGKVGSTVSNEAKDLIKTPPTVVMRKGSGFGVLFMSDFKVPV